MYNGVARLCLVCNWGTLFHNVDLDVFNALNEDHKILL